MKLEAFYYKDLESFLNTIKTEQENEYCLLVAKECAIDFTILSTLPIRIVGGIFPEIIYNDKLYTQGLIALSINSTKQLHLIENMQEPKLEHYNFNGVKAVLTVFDGLSHHTEGFLQTLFSCVEINTKIFGGGAGWLKQKGNPSIFDNHQYYSEAAILLSMQLEVSLGIQHGWEYLEGPFVATSSHEYVLKGIDYKNAFEMYKSVVEKDSGLTLSEENFLDISKTYPLGILKYRGEQIVRDPVRLENDGLALIGHVPINTVINILKGDKQTLLNATHNAVQEAIKEGCKIAIIFDCFTRKNFLEEKFEDELDIIHQKNNAIKLIGVISMGEVANNGQEYVNFLNKTCVIGGICF